jgi:hypothetical protein
LLSPPAPFNDPPTSLTTTLAPLDAKNRAYAFPSAPPAPVTTTVWLSKWSSSLLNVLSPLAPSLMRGRGQCQIGLGRAWQPGTTM